MIQAALNLIRADVLAKALLRKWDETDPRIQAAIADKAGMQHVDDMARLVAANVRSVDPVTVAELKRQVRPFDAQCKKWDHKRSRRVVASGVIVEPTDPEAECS